MKYRIMTQPLLRLDEARTADEMASEFERVKQTSKNQRNLTEEERLWISKFFNDSEPHVPKDISNLIIGYAEPTSLEVACQKHHCKQEQTESIMYLNLRRREEGEDEYGQIGAQIPPSSLKIYRKLYKKKLNKIMYDAMKQYLRNHWHLFFIFIQLVLIAVSFTLKFEFSVDKFFQLMIAYFNIKSLWIITYRGCELHTWLEFTRQANILQFLGLEEAISPFERGNLEKIQIILQP